MLESVNLVKKAMCTMTLPMVDTVSPSPLAYAAVTFCKSNDTLFEVSLLTLNQVRVCVFLCACVRIYFRVMPSCFSL